MKTVEQLKDMQNYGYSFSDLWTLDEIVSMLINKVNEVIEGYDNFVQVPHIKGNFDHNETYKKFDLINYNGETYICKKTCYPPCDITNKDYFEKLSYDIDILKKAISHYDSIEEWNKYFTETSGKIEEKYTLRLNELFNLINKIPHNCINVKSLGVIGDGNDNDMKIIEQAMNDDNIKSLYFDNIIITKEIKVLKNIYSSNIIFKQNGNLNMCKPYTKIIDSNLKGENNYNGTMIKISTPYTQIISTKLFSDNIGDWTGIKIEPIYDESSPFYYYKGIHQFILDKVFIYKANICVDILSNHKDSWITDSTIINCHFSYYKNIGINFTTNLNEQINNGISQINITNTEIQDNVTSSNLRYGVKIKDCKNLKFDNTTIFSDGDDINCIGVYQEYPLLKKLLDKKDGSLIYVMLKNFLGCSFTNCNTDGKKMFNECYVLNNYINSFGYRNTLKPDKLQYHDLLSWAIKNNKIKFSTDNEEIMNCKDNKIYYKCTSSTNAIITIDLPEILKNSSEYSITLRTNGLWWGLNINTLSESLITSISSETYPFGAETSDIYTKKSMFSFITSNNGTTRLQIRFDTSFKEGIYEIYNIFIVPSKVTLNDNFYKTYIMNEDKLNLN